MQSVAGEMNLSETAFLRRRPDGAFDLRWFTPFDYRPNLSPKRRCARCVPTCTGWGPSTRAA